MDHNFSVIRSTEETFVVKPNLLTCVPVLPQPFFLSFFSVEM